ncbi:MAG: hypothetical protein HOA17_04360 [Candidatus Melainabacteria bacterium]|jgi:hypothetical protein|nr:hypothetical protein [Candidatus Melainabacteria bacterium]
MQTTTFPQAFQRVIDLLPKLGAIEELATRSGLGYHYHPEDQNPETVEADLIQMTQLIEGLHQDRHGESFDPADINTFTEGISSGLEQIVENQSRSQVAFPNYIKFPIAAQDSNSAKMQTAHSLNQLANAAFITLSWFDNLINHYPVEQINHNFVIETAQKLQSKFQAIVQPLLAINPERHQKTIKQSMQSDGQLQDTMKAKPYLLRQLGHHSATQTA